MPTYNVYGLSDWPESLGEKFLIFDRKEFSSQTSAATSAKKAYNDALEVIVEPIPEKK